jgi:hypothetical protein
MMKPTLKNPILVAAALAIGLSGCTNDTSEPDYKNVSNQETAVVQEQSTEEIQESHDDTSQAAEAQESTITPHERLVSSYDAIDSYVENKETSHLAYSQDRSMTFLAYDPSLSLLYLQLDEGTDATLTLDSLIHSYDVLEGYSEGQQKPIVRRGDDTSSVAIESKHDSRVILELMSDIYAPSLYSEGAFDPERITFGYDDSTLDSFVEETERHPIYDGDVKAQAARIMETIAEENQDNPYHVLSAIQDWVEETNGTTQGYVTLARTYGIPSQVVETYTPDDGKADVAAVYLEPYGWMLTNPHIDGSIDNFSESDDYYFKIGEKLQEKGVELYAITADERYEQLDTYLEEISVARHNMQD